MERTIKYYFAALTLCALLSGCEQNINQTVQFGNDGTIDIGNKKYALQPVSPSTSVNPTPRTSLSPSTSPTSIPGAAKTASPPVTISAEPSRLKEDLPINPANVQAKYLSDTSFELSWQAVRGAQAYFVLKANGNAIEVIKDEITDTKVTINGASLSGNQVYLVGSINDTGRSNNVTEVSIELVKIKESTQPLANLPQQLPSQLPIISNTPNPVVSVIASISPTISPSVLPTPTPTPTPSIVPTPSPTPTPISTPSPTPTPTPTPISTEPPSSFGNSYVGFLNVATPQAALASVAGIDIKGQSLFVSHIVDGFTTNDRNVRQINLLTGPQPDFAVFKTTTGLTPVISGVAVNSSNEVWSVLGKPDGNGYNLYRHNATGTQIDRHKINSTDANTVINDVAVSGNLVYIACQTTSSIFKFDVSNSANTQILFSGATAINPIGVAVDSSGNVYTTDLISRKVIKFSSTGTRVLEFDGKGTNGTGTAFSAMADVAVDPRNGDIYVLGDTGSGGKRVFRYTSAGNFVHSFTNTNLVSPDKMAIHGDGQIFITDNSKQGIANFAAGL